MTKRELRTTFLARRRQLTPSEVKLRSQSICENFFASTNLEDVKLLHVYLPIKKNNEPDSWLIIDRIQKQHPGVSVVVPRINPATDELDHILLNSQSKLEENKWGIPEITSGEHVMARDIDMVLVPLLAFDMTGNRVGYGKGYYDRFLAGCRLDCIRTGISLFEGVQQIEDVDEFDQPLHHCITPWNVVHF